jgi:hypothetical protein
MQRSMKYSMQCSRRQSFRVKINLLLLAMAVAVLAPLRFLPAACLSSGQLISDDPCQVVRDCCARMAACCCEIQPTRPAPPADLALADIIYPTARFLAGKDGGKLIAQDLPPLLLRPQVFTAPAFQPQPLALIGRPLYILNRALLL